MTNQTENYLLLKPLSERVNRICSSMSDQEIMSLIRSAMMDQIKGAFKDIRDRLSEYVEEVIDLNSDAISDMVKESIVSALHLDRSCAYGWKKPLDWR